MCGHKGHGTELVECTVDRTAVECTVVDYTVAVRWDFAVLVVAAAAVEQSAVPAAAAAVEQSAVPAAAAAVEQSAVPAAAVVPVAAVGVSAVPAAEH